MHWVVVTERLGCWHSPIATTVEYILYLVTFVGRRRATDPESLIKIRPFFQTELWKLFAKIVP